MKGLTKIKLKKQKKLYIETHMLEEIGVMQEIMFMPCGNAQQKNQMIMLYDRKQYSIKDL